MAFSLTKILKGLRLSQENTTSPANIDIIPAGTASTTTTITTSQTVNQTLTLPNATDTVVARNTSEALTNKTVVVASNIITTAASGNLAATELNAALVELQSDIDTRALNSDLTNHINDITDAHDASAISNIPSGNLVATDVQAALNELQSDINNRSTTTLNNLGTTAINADLLPDINAGRNLGSTSFKYLEAHTSYVKGPAGGDLQLDAARVLINAAQTNLADPSGTDPVSDLIAGNVYYNNVSNKYRYYNGASWQDLTPSAITNPMDSEGDLIVGGVAGAPIKLDAGTTSQILRGGLSPSFGNVPVAALAGQSAITPFASSGTFTSLANSSTSTVYKYRIVGAGGGGGGSNGAAAAAGGGGGGSYAEGTFTGITASTGITITVGAGGTAGSSAGGTGGTGGTSSIGIPVSITCTGGAGGQGSTSGVTAGSAGGTGGTASGSVNGFAMSGNNGGRAWWLISDQVGYGGTGASTPVGFGGVGASANVAAAGASGVGYGAGGGGSVLLTQAGAAGQGGLIVIEQLTP